MSPFLRALAVSMVLPVPAALAQAPQPDNATILKAIQKLNQRMDRLEKAPAEEKSNSSSAPSAPSLLTTQPARKNPPADSTIPGWMVEAIPADNDAKDAVANFSSAAPEFNFGMHTKYVPGHNPYTYRGTARFNPDQKGRYVFQLTLDPVRHQSGNSFTCVGNIKINGETVAEGRASGANGSGDFNTKGEILTPATFSGGTELEPQTDPKKGYVITFQVSCFLFDRDHTEQADYLFKPWQDNRFAITVKGPDDAAGRPFDGSELYHGGRVKAAR